MILNRFNRILSSLAVACSVSVLPSCSQFDEPGTGSFIRMNVSVETNSVSVPDFALSESSPFHVVGFAREKQCEPFYRLFESDAYSKDGSLTWMGKDREWPGEYMKFVAYWPADADVYIDTKGNVVSADCVLIAETTPACHLDPTVSLTFQAINEYFYGNE